MQDVYEYFRTDRKAKIFAKFRSGYSLSIGDYAWLITHAIFSEFPKAVVLGFPTGIGNKLRLLYFGRKFARIGKNSILGKSLTINGERNISIGSYTWVDDYVTVAAAFGELKIGNRVHVAPFSILSAGGGLYIEDFVGIASHVHIYSHSEVPKKGKSMAGPMVDEVNKGFKSEPVYLKANCFISAGAIILPGVTVGEGALIGANSVVTKNVEPWSIMIGNPAKKVGRRPKCGFPSV